MKVEFIGVGEAFDETLPNNSQILEWNNFRMLVDCGYAVPHSIWKLHPEAEHLDAIYISHRHADHYFGLPSYLTRLAEDGRKRSIEIVCAQGMKDVILNMIDYGYEGILPKLGFEVLFHEVSWKEAFEFHGARLEFAPSSHPVLNYALSVNVNNRRYAYSGDGNFNPYTRVLYRGCNLLVHESYWFDTESKSHASVIDVLAMAKEEGVKLLCLTHLQRKVRKEKAGEIQNLIEKSGFEVMIPNVGDVIEV
ncbi:MAG TPA: ribonuclease Z [Acidobacteriota bacterium]|nr:ribonuclease Z [Acidobacteriota bacterium]